VSDLNDWLRSSLPGGTETSSTLRR